MSKTIAITHSGRAHKDDFFAMKKEIIRIKGILVKIGTRWIKDSDNLIYKVTSYGGDSNCEPRVELYHSDSHTYYHGSLKDFQAQFSPIPPEQLVVCAAIKHRQTNQIICGVRHGDCINLAVEFGIDVDSETWDCGFVDQNREFLTRSEAWEVADKAGQIRRPYSLEPNYENVRKPNIGDKQILFSENLY